MLSSRLLVVVFLLMGLCSSFSSSSTDDDVGLLVQVKEGSIRGKRDTSVDGKQFNSFLGIPYAQPPTGTLRFRDPIPAEPWSEVIGTKMPDYCPQLPFYIKEQSKPFGNEDCLYLNVYTPQRKDDGRRLPVMVFIHGGAFIVGGSRDYLPHVIMNSDAIVLVVVQYRLGILGFLSTEDEVLPGNMGLKDQQLALKWVQQNIQAFGGDPDKVTIFGESAGAASVHMQILSPGSKGLFHRAIAQSGTALCPWSMSVKHREFAEQVGDKFKCPLSDGSEKYLACMQKVDSSSLLWSAIDTVKWGLGPLYVIPRVDGSFIPDSVEVLLKEGRYNKVDLIAGKTKHEGGFFMSMAQLDPDMIKGLRKHFKETGPMSLNEFGVPMPVDLAEEVYRHYVPKDPKNISIPEDRPELVKLYSDFFFGQCLDEAAFYHTKDKDMSVFLYELTFLGQRSFSDFHQFNRYNWSSHGDDLYYLFTGGESFTLKQLTYEADLKLRENFLSLWTNFADTGNPTPPGSDFIWEKATPGNLQHLNLKPEPEMEPDNYAQAREFWASIKAKKNKRSQSKVEL